jgi:hypothetical protein
MPNAPHCSRCERELFDWQGNVMVDSAPYLEQHRIGHIFLLCKQCTRRIDAESNGNERFHHLWELQWLEHGFFNWLGSALYNVTAHTGTQWSRVALLELCRIGAISYPDEMNRFIAGFIHED